MSETVLKKSRPNGHLVCLMKYEDGEDSTYWVTEPDNEDGVEFDGDLEEAQRYFEKAVEEWAKIPNWEAQARYDEIHGTDNGYSPMPRREY